MPHFLIHALSPGTRRSCRGGLGGHSRALSPSGDESLQQLEEPEIQMRPPAGVNILICPVSRKIQYS
ncbi:hypothetical protein ACRRTK_003448 [Alexandromys fortis]